MDSTKTYSHCCHFLVSGSRYDLTSANICCQKCVVTLHRAKKQRRIVQNVQPPLGFKGCDANACFSLQIFGLSINNNSNRPVVYKADLHIGAELTGFDFGAEQLL